MGCGGSKDKERPPSSPREDEFTHSGGQQSASAGQSSPQLGERKLSNAEAELVSLEAMTNFDANEIECLRTKYNEIANIRTSDGIIYQDEFMETLLGPKKAKKSAYPLSAPLSKVRHEQHWQYRLPGLCEWAVSFLSQGQSRAENPIFLRIDGHSTQ